MALLNERIKERRLAHSMKLLEVAEYLDVKEATVQRYESGEIKNIKHETIVSLAELFGCSPAYLMGWEENPYPQSSITKKEQAYLHKYRSIDDKGRHTVDTVLEMEYNRCHKLHLLVNAAHANGEPTEEQINLSNEIMDNDDNWN